MVKESKRNVQISPRLPPSTYNWINEKVEAGEYPNINQAVLAILARAQAEEEREQAYSEASTDIEEIKGRLDALESENNTLKSEIESIKELQDEVMQLTTILAKYRNTLLKDLI